MSQFETPWFPHEVKPIHRGWYKVRFRIGKIRHFQIGWAHWNGKLWSNRIISPRSRTRWNAQWTQGACQEKEWKGLNYNPLPLVGWNDE